MFRSSVVNFFKGGYREMRRLFSNSMCGNWQRRVSSDSMFVIGNCKLCKA